MMCHITESNWWKGLSDNMNWSLPSTDESLAVLLNEYVDNFTDFLTVGYVHTLFSSIESSFRIWALDANAYHKGTDDFMNI